MGNITLNIEKIRSLEAPFKLNNYHGNNTKCSHTFVEGSACSHILVGAPHTIKTTTKSLKTRDIVKAISMAKEDADNKLVEIALIGGNPKELEVMKPINFDDKKYSIYDMADVTGLNPYVLKYYYNKTATEIEKAEELYTGAITMLMGDLVGCHIMVRNNYNDVTASTNHYNPYLIEYIKDHDIRFYLDIHGAAESCSFDLAPGTNNGEYIGNLPVYQAILINSFTKYGITNINFNSKFQASTKHTLCNQVWNNARIKTTQLEINRKLRNPLHDIDKMNQLINGLACYIEELNKEEEKGINYGKVLRP